MLLRTIKSYVKREGRITTAQRDALENIWPELGIPFLSITDCHAAFANNKPLILEIGFGNGNSLCQTALQYPDYNFIGIEVHRPGVGHALQQAKALGLTNLKFISHDAVDVLHQMVTDHSLAAIHIFFPDPWPKKKHHKRRLIQPAFLTLLTTKLVLNGTLHIATDWQPYAEHIAEVIAATPILQTREKPWLIRQPSKYEARGLRLGYAVSDFIYDLTISANGYT